MDPGGLAALVLATGPTQLLLRRTEEAPRSRRCRSRGESELFHTHLLYFRVQPVERTCHSLNGGGARCPAWLCRHRLWRVRSPRGWRATPPLQQTPGAERHSDVWRWRLPGAPLGPEQQSTGGNSGAQAFCKGPNSAQHSAALQQEARLTLHPGGGAAAGWSGGQVAAWTGSLHPVPPATRTTRPDSPVPPPPTDTDASSESSPVCH